MGREIKFRAFYEGRMVPVNLLYLPQMFANSSEVDGNLGMVPIMMFTGLVDIDGLDSYDGDIIQDEEATYKIYWAEDAAAWDLERLQDGSNMIGFGCYTRDVISDIIQSSKNIGNIHQNPELL